MCGGGRLSVTRGKWVIEVPTAQWCTMIVALCYLWNKCFWQEKHMSEVQTKKRNREVKLKEPFFPTLHYGYLLHLIGKIQITALWTLFLHRDTLVRNCREEPCWTACEVSSSSLCRLTRKMKTDGWRVYSRDGQTDDTWKSAAVSLCSQRITVVLVGRIKCLTFFSS